MEINFYQVLFQAINFGIILAVLTKFLYNPIRKVLEEREDKINAGLKAAEKKLKAESEIEKLKKNELAKARRESARIMKEAEVEAKKQAEVVLKEARDKAKKEAERIVESAEVSIKAKEKEQEKALKTLVVETTAKLLGDSLTQKDVERVTKKMASSLK